MTTFPVLDTVRDHYQVVSIGWKNRCCFLGFLIHLTVFDVIFGEMN
ncbi:MAG TPA: XisI protein [Oscillatoriales cyanobacterium M59_W2019_021]|nr:MAG: hypothetical protein D6728_03215 [Cyanobacteria bacterium J055]HIK30978.1 XisI protein [Oscillatoriales cyanobacterium M4454_W2019_049]HIK50852.1 XisI protein [Oscillatoriales cyanobacterium M59_W2019_021]